jgi:ERCC4-related helicase
MDLIALLSSDQETWSQISGLMSHGDWEKIILIGDESGKTFSHEKPFEFIKVDLTKKIKDLREEFSQKIKGKFEGMEVACSIASGNGKEHMALISAIINLPLGIRFAALTKEGIIDL